MTLRAIDVHAHFSTREGNLSTLKYAQGLASYYMKREVTAEQVLSFSKSDEEMAQDFIKAGVKGIVVGWDAEGDITTGYSVRSGKGDQSPWAWASSSSWWRRCPGRPTTETWAPC